MKNAESCPMSHPHKLLSYTTAIICVILFASTSLLNSLIVYIIHRDRSKKFRILFYRLLLNIAISDVMVGLLADTLHVGIHISEAENAQLKREEIALGHMIMFILGGVSLLTMVYLCIDRIYAILRPYSYRKGIPKAASRVLVASTWVVSITTSSLYLLCGYMKYMVIFSSFNIALPFCVLLITTAVYYVKLVKESPFDECTEGSSETSALKRSHIKKGRKATASFLKMLIVFIVSYLPASFITIYFNVCNPCNCLLISILRDVSLLFILSGSLFRAINFLVSLKPLRKEASSILFKNFADTLVTDSVSP